MVIFSMLQNYFVNKYLVKKYLVFIFLFFLLQKFDVSDVLAVGFNEEIGQFSHPRPFTHRHHLENEIEATWNAIDKVSDELKELEQEHSQKIKLLNDRKNLEEEINSLEIEYSSLLDRQYKYNLEKQKSEEMLSILQQQEIKNLPLYSKETEQISFAEFKENMEQIWFIVNDTHEKLKKVDPENIIIKPSEDGNKLTEMLDLLEKDYLALLNPKEDYNSQKTEQKFSVKLQEIQGKFFDRVAEAEETFSVKLKVANEQLKNLQGNISDIEEQMPLLEQKVDEHNQLLISIDKKANKITELKETRDDLESKLHALDDNIMSLLLAQSERRNIPNEFEEFVPVENDKQVKPNKPVQQLKDEGDASLDNLAIRDTPSPTITESNQTAPQQISRKRKRVDSEDESLDDIPPTTRNSLSLRDELEAAKKGIVGHAAIVLITEPSPVMERATDMPPATKTATATVTVTSPIAQKATIMATPVIHIAPIIEEVSVMEIATTTDMPPATKTATATVTVTSPITQKATVMPTPVIYMAPIIEEVSVMEIATTTDMPPATKTATVDAHPTLVSEHTNTADTKTVATQTDIVDEQQTSVAIQTDVAAEKPVHEVIQQAAVSVDDNADVDPYEIFGDNLGLETLFAEEEPIAAEPTAPVDDPPSSVVKQPDQADEQPTLVAKQANSETEQINLESEQPDSSTEQTNLESEQPDSSTEQTNLESEQPDSSTEQTNLESEQPDSSTEQTNLESEQPDSSTEQTNLESEQPDSSTEQTNLESEQPNSVAIPSSQTLAEENSYISPINPDVEQDISKYTTYIEFDYLDTISNALTNHTLTDNSTVNVVASGDNDYIKKGGWIQFISSITKQQQQGNILAFKNNQQGFILGFDTRPLDSFIIGIAYALANSYTKLQTIFNDKQNTILHVAAIYTQHTLSPNIYLNSYLKYGKAFIKNKGERNNIAINSKTNGYVTRAKLETYYKMNLDKFLFKPIVGITFDHFLINNFTEYRKEFNINVPTKKGKRILLETGISLSKNILVENISIIPEIHVKLDNTLLLNNPTGIITFTNTSHQAPIVVPIIKPVGSSAKNVKYTLGGYVNVQSVLPFKLGAGYDYSFKKDLITHSFYFNGLIKF
ncbi:autotransporter domain-containing protein [Rickettsia endosymbiont of Culicoides newsteadi]|uniref:autotransporter domain-containing protein n=1 Tax=Rickettsia endosymbiont of Culicoides newsteadi TaxID=1961830 RepID=UPI000B9B2363|nr:autotransporter domain-containing protein [Rickettsia endosymbiont of Culicoides newsteadi]OZG32357.1 surface cell antigen sca2 [Rickettsia endosymbiont of Culicoides newsteadi]